MVKENHEIIGIDLGNTQHKLIQFADDTTLILEGTACFLQAALNTLEIFGTICGLKINTDKTKVIWSGKKTNSKDKLKVSVKLHWGATEFKLLGLHFSVDLAKIPKLNYSVPINKINSIISLWKILKEIHSSKIIVREV